MKLHSKKNCIGAEHYFRFLPGFMPEIKLISTHFGHPTLGATLIFTFEA